MSSDRRHAGICSLDDFSDPDFIRTGREIAPDVAAQPPHRKLWEWVRGALFLRERGVLNGAASVLDVGAGTEPILFWLAQRVGAVLATDIYGEGEFSGTEAAAGFLQHPERYAPYEYPRERLTVARQDARRLELPDCAFDAVVSFSSIEHVGRREDVCEA